MHFPIIKIEPIDLDRENWDIDLDYEDPVLQENTDYYGELYSEPERRQVIESSWLRNLFEGIATIDTKEETITFLNRDTISTTLNEYFHDCANSLFAMEELSGFDFRQVGRHFRDYYTLFVGVEGCGMTSVQFVEDAVFRAGNTFRIGNIFDAHI